MTATRVRGPRGRRPAAHTSVTVRNLDVQPERTGRFPAARSILLVLGSHAIDGPAVAQGPFS
jgi:hypothetical protein